MQRKILFFILVPLHLFGITFHELERHVGEEVEIRGFLYHKEGEIWVLASEPNLKSCCVGKAKQIFVKGDFQETNYVVTMRGKLVREGSHQRYQLELSK